MSKLTEYPQSGNLIEKRSISVELEEKYQIAKRETPTAFNEPDVFGKIEVDELFWLGQKILNCSSVWQAYDILAEASPNGLPYYDLVIGPQHRRAVAAIYRAIEASIFQRVKNGLDIGTGTGISALALGRKCEFITAIDLNPSLLKWAGKKLEELQKKEYIEGYQICLADALGLEFFANSFDVTISHGLDSYLSPDEFSQFYQGVYRVLKPGGSFFKYLSDLPSDHPVYSTSSKAELAGVVAKGLLSLTYAPFYQTLRDFPLYQDLPFQEELFLVKNSFYNERVLRLIKPEEW